MIAKLSSAKNEIKVIGLVDQGAHSLGSSDLFDWDLRTTGYFIFKQVESLESPPLVIAGTSRTNEISVLDRESRSLFPLASMQVG